MNSILKSNVANRDILIDSVRQEIIGPTIDFKHGTEIIDFESSQKLSDNKLYYYLNDGIAEEVFTVGRPSRHYAAGLLYPHKDNNFKNEENMVLDQPLELENQIQIEDKDIKEEENEERLYNSYKSSSMGFTFALPKEVSEIEVSFSCGTYEKYFPYQNSNRTWWKRNSIKMSEIINLKQRDLNKKEINLNKETNHKVMFYSYIRPVELLDSKRELLICTITIENISNHEDEDEGILFQCQLEANIHENFSFLSYPKASEIDSSVGEDTKRFEMLYESERNFAFGHDCSTKWDISSPTVKQISTTFLPEYEIKTMTPDIKLNGKTLEIHHAQLAGANSYEEIKTIFQPLIAGYEEWAEALNKEEVSPAYEKVKNQNINLIFESINRIKKGLELLKDLDILNCFKLTNLVMLMQMNMGKNIRPITWENGLNIEDDYMDPFENLNYHNLDNLSSSIKERFEEDEGNSFFKISKWRGFQIAFLLQSLDSIINQDSPDREIVDLIWFPTGGGKTEAYLAVSAFSMLYRRTLNPCDKGVDVIMRYTLRLLTADQFQRSSRLLLSMEYIRRKYPELLGDDEYSIGLWVGSGSTPNYSTEAQNQLREYEENNKSNFMVSSCPWCGAEFKVLSHNHRKALHYHGYRAKKHSIEIYCPDKKCAFHNHIPIYFVDEDLYDNPPTFLIGTIDKFVQITWNERARYLFGINKDGVREYSAPNIIIQDELHLISGSLGSLSGIYEILIEELCTNERNGKRVKPKIICATATIRGFSEQIKSLYNRDNAKLFPPSGLDINDNYFSTVLYDKETKLPAPGRKYIGVYTSTQGKLMSQVQVFSSLITGTEKLPDKEKDPFWTNLSFYNTINDIGKGLTLTQQDIPYYISNYFKQRNLKQSRYIRDKYILELTSRFDSAGISQAISTLKIPYKTESNEAVDICLASNIIEVGVDINRLSLMTIVGQPKSSSQYIQVSGRVGRRVTERPGLVVTIYKPTNSVDKSIFEHFNEYHQKLYAQVEENSVTPFSKFSINRGVPAIVIGYLRQFFKENGLGQAPNKDEVLSNKNQIQSFFKRIIDRASQIDSSEEDHLRKKLKVMLEAIISKTYDGWKYTGKNQGFMDYLSQDKGEVPEDVIQVINSMRNVDLQSMLEVKNISVRGEIDEWDF